METTYGIDVRNRFDLCFDDDVEDPLEILKQQEAELLKRKSEKAAKDKPKHGKQQQTAVAVGSKAKKEVISTAPPKANIDTEKSQFRPAKSGGRQAERPGAYEDKNRRNVEPSFADGQWDTEPRRGRGGSRGARGVSRGRPTGYDQRGKREFDRHSGSTKSGVKPVEKKEGGGAHNWGVVADDIPFPEIPDNEERSSDEGPAIGAGGDAKDDGAVEKAKEPEDAVMTLDEWKRKEQSKRCIPSYNLRKPGEGETDKKWGKVYLLKKKDLDEDDDEEEEEDDDEEVVKRGRQKQMLDIEIRFEDMSVRGRGRGRGGFARGGRGGRNVAPGGGGTGGTVGGGGVGDTVSRPAPVAAHLPAPKVDDFVDFPSLSNT